MVAGWRPSPEASFRFCEGQRLKGMVLVGLLSSPAPSATPPSQRSKLLLCQLPVPLLAGVRPHTVSKSVTDQERSSFSLPRLRPREITSAWGGWVGASCPSALEP